MRDSIFDYRLSNNESQISTLESRANDTPSLTHRRFEKSRGGGFACGAEPLVAETFVDDDLFVLRTCGWVVIFFPVADVAFYGTGRRGVGRQAEVGIYPAFFPLCFFVRRLDVVVLTVFS